MSTDRNHKRAVLAAVGGAVGLSVLSRCLGFVRELLIVGRIGVHDYTDAYFATSTVVLWLQNWSFGAWPLYFVPKYLALPLKERHQWFWHRVRITVAATALGATAFVVAYPRIESILLGGRAVLTRGPAIELALALPATATAGVFYARLTSFTKGILLAAQGLLIGNLVGLLTLAVLVIGIVPPAHVLPLTLLGTQAATLIALAVAVGRFREDVEETRAATRTINSSNAIATTVENVGFNVNAVAHQAIAGRLPAGGVTMNAYVTRLLLLPVSGLMAPVHQRLLQHFSGKSARQGLGLAARVVAASVGLGVVVGVAAFLGLLLITPALPHRLADPIRAYHLTIVALGYGCYAGVLFSNGVMARWYFASGAGWTYATVMLCGYAVGTAVKALSLPHHGMVALPAGAVLGEGAALACLLLLGHRKHISVVPDAVAPV